MKLLQSALCGLAAAASWEYPENQATGSWGPECTDQKFGSPIDLDYTYRNFNFKYLDYVDEENNDLFKFRGYDTDVDWKLSDNGHSIAFQIANEDHDYNSIGMSGGKLGKTYNFHSFHFHWGDRKMGGGSEHTLNGNHHFAEVHFVHYGQHCESLKKCIERNDDGTAKYPDGLAVYGAFLELDENIKEEDVNERLRNLLDKAVILNRNDIDDKVFKKNGNFALADLVGDVDTNAFYRYMGSLTTPTCNESVQWTVFADTIKINARYARRFLNTVDKGMESGSLEDNFRGVQPYAGREVSFYSFDPSASKMILANQRRFDNMRTRRMGKKNY